MSQSIASVVGNNFPSAKVNFRAHNFGLHRKDHYPKSANRSKDLPRLCICGSPIHVVESLNQS